MDSGCATAKRSAYSPARLRAAALISARQFRQVAKSLGPAVVPPGYWTQAGVALNVIIAMIALALAAHFLWPLD